MWEPFLVLHFQLQPITPEIKLNNKKNVQKVAYINFENIEIYKKQVITLF